MLPPYLIQEIRDREERAREQVREQPRLELPVRPAERKTSPDLNEDRGLSEIQIWG